MHRRKLRHSLSTLKSQTISTLSSKLILVLKSTMISSTH
ncbi:unnamed protein product [Cylicostephanus goldi]|uniref:Uncharacterized protein n=1 Tax=Cylicostephanus goldi TaxID=71465 RepID=A0A3P7NKG7_CYLGO|nr:unnamed protein product [Cylicostephanus goldi]